MFHSKRLFEAEVMESYDEVVAYDALTKQFLAILHNGFVETVINKGTQKGRFLEVGSGTGWISIGIAKYNPNVEITCIDLSENMIKVAKSNSNQENVGDRVSFQVGSAVDIPFEDNSFDTVYCHNMLHHIPDPEKMVSEMSRVLKNDGGLFIRDLIRVSPLIIPLHVHVLGFRYNYLMKKEYRDSIKASLSRTEWKTLFSHAEIPGAKLTTHFITHQGMEKISLHRRNDYLSIPTPIHLKFFKNMYV